MKSKKIIAVIIAIVLLISTVGAIVYIKSNSNHNEANTDSGTYETYAAGIGKEDIAQITGLNLDKFNVVDSYTKRNEINSSIKSKVYNELLIAKLNAVNTDDNANCIPNDFQVCNTNVELIENINNGFQKYNISWINNFKNSDITWYKRVQQFEDKTIKSSATLYLLKSNSSNEYYIILDQTNV